MSDALDQLFGGTLQVPPAARPQEQQYHVPSEAGDALVELPIDLLQDFPSDKHPFRPYTQEKLDSLKQDIVARGVIQPLIVRPLGDHVYQIISGHNRRTASRAAGYTVLPCIVRHLDDDEALLQMISTNLQQRQDLRPSEKAFAYKMQLDAINRQGLRFQMTSGRLGQKWSRDSMADEVPDSSRQIQRYIRLTYLIPSLLDKVDEKKIGFTVGETLSYLKAESQQIVDNFFFSDQHMGIDQRAADQLRELEQNGQLADDRLRKIFLSPVVKPLRKIRLEYKSIKQYFPADTTEKEIRETIQEALKLYFKTMKEG